MTSRRPHRARGIARIGRAGRRLNVFLGFALAAIFLCLPTRVPAAASPRFTVDVWATKTGEFPCNVVIAMTQTRDNYLWVGTSGGLACFDGIQFTPFSASELNGVIVCLFEDSRSNLWVGTGAGDVLTIDRGRVTKMAVGPGGPGGRLAAVAEDATGAIWLYTVDGQLCRYENGATNVWPAGPSLRRPLIAEKNGPVWVGADHFLLSLEPKSKFATGPPPIQQWRECKQMDLLLAAKAGGSWRLLDGFVQKWEGNRLVRNFPYPWGDKNYATCICEDRSGNLVVGTFGAGVFWFDAEGKATHISDEQGLSHNYILSLCVDREGNLWVGTDGGGLDRVKRPAFSVLEGTGALTVQSVCEDAGGGIWLNSHGGVKYWKDDVLTNYNTAGGVGNVNGRTVFVDHDQNVWAGSLAFQPPGLFRLETNEFQTVSGLTNSPHVSVIEQDHAGVLWVGTEGGLAGWDGRAWKFFTIREGLVADAVQAIAEDAAGTLWIGTSAGLNRLADGTLHTVAGAEGADISSLLTDTNGVLWVGTQGRGLARLQDGRWTRYTRRDGFPSDSIGYIIDDGRGNLWIGSNTGLIRASKNSLNDFALSATNSVVCRAYGQEDGLPTSECSAGAQPAACRAADGTLWFSTIKGLVSVKPANIELNTNPPPVRIESVLIEDQPQNTNDLHAPLPDTIIVPPNKERLDIHYTSLNLAAPERTRFKYWMENHEALPTDAEHERTAHYPKLPPGHYIFHVTACNEDGVWNEQGATLAIIVQPPFWRTWWFITITSVLLLAAIARFVHYFATQRLQRQLEGLRQQQALEKDRRRIARDIHDQLGANLTQIAMLGEMAGSDKDSPAEVEDHANQISRAARDTSRALDEIVWAVNPSNDTLDGLITYFCKYAQEYLEVAGLRYRLEIPGELPAAPIPPEVRHNVFLAAKESVTNVVRHAKATDVKIRLRIEPARFVLEIEDNGQGMAGMDEKRARTRNGLGNMRKRLEEIGGSCTLTPGSQGGTIVSLVAPLKTGA